MAIATLVIAIIPDLVTLPEPDGAIVLVHATYLPGNGSGSEVSLPHAVYPSSTNLDRVRYLISFDLQAAPNNNLFLFIPSTNRRIALAFNGESLLEFESSALWTGPLVSAPVMLRLPSRGIVAGRQQLTVVVEQGPFAAPAYLSQIYLGTEAALAWRFKLRNFLDSQLKTMALAVHFVLGLGLIFCYFLRPNDPLFTWLAALNVVSLIVAIGVQIGWQPALRGILPFINILIPALGFLFLGFAVAVLDLRPPKALRYAAIAVPCLLLPFALIDNPSVRMILAPAAIAILVVSYVAATGLLAWGAVRRDSRDARLILAPVALLAWFSVRDVYVTVTIPEHGLNLLVAYTRPLLFAFVTAMLMRRMAVSLDQVDMANETLSRKLAEREVELAALHRQERVKTVARVREHERMRLTHDLHDGLSGHLVSIIALSERAGDKPTEQAAREALNDLRLVIYSLDLGDRELPLALANFRERLVPQLHRLGVELDWSIANLPEITGVTPGNALAVLRIMQEAITNAIKHGPARKIAIRGALSADGTAAITIENDGRAFVENNGGHGLANMRRRAQQLHGNFNIEAMSQGAKVTLLLPFCLPDFEDEAAVP